MSKNETLLVNAPGQCATGMYRVGIVDGKTHRVKYMSDWRHNLILNSGMYAIATRSWVECMIYAYAGDSATANYEDSGVTTAASDASGNVTLAGGAFTFATATVGDCILWDGGEQGRLVSIDGGFLAAVITPAPGGGGISAAEFSLVKTSRSQFVGTNLKKVTSYLAGVPNQLSQRVGNVCTSRNTYDFDAETGTVTYNEIGLSWQSVTPPAQPVLFSRIVLAAPLVLNSGDYLRVVYQLQVTITPTTVVTATPTITGWPVSPSVTTQGDGSLYNVGISTVNVGATSVGSNLVTGFDTLSNEPSVVGSGYVMWLSYYAVGHAGSWPQNGPARGPGGTASYITPSLQVATRSNLYALGLTYSQEKEGKWAIGQANTSPIRVLGMGYENISIFGDTYPYIAAGFIFEFDEDQFKLNTQTLTLRLRYSWSRTLTLD